MALKLFINSLDKTDDLLANTFSVDDSLNGRNTSRFRLIDVGDSRYGTAFYGTALQGRNQYDTYVADEAALACGQPVQIGDITDSTAEISEAVAVDETVINVSDGSVFAAGDFITIGTQTEILKIASVDTSGSPDTITVQHGAMGTTAETHADTDTIYDWTAYFAGTIDDLRVSPLEAKLPAREYSVNCVDWNQIFDRFLVTAEFTDTNSGQIVVDIVNNAGMFQHVATTATLTSLENVTAALNTGTGQVDVGFAVEHIIFNYQTVTQCLNQLAEISGGYWWSLDYNKDLIFGEFGATAQAITDANAETYLINGSVQKLETRDQFRNQQFMRGALAEADAITSYHKASVGANGNSTVTFTTPRPISGTVSAWYYNSGWQAYASSAIGIKDIDTGKTIYWEKGSPNIEVTDATDLKQYKFTFKYLYPSIEFSESIDSINTRKTVEDNSGMYARIETLPDLTLESGKDRADGLVTQYGTIRSDMAYESEIISWVAGSKQTITLTGADISNTIFLITKRRVFDFDGKSLRASYALMEGKVRKSWVDWFRRIYESQLRTFNTNEVLQMVREVPKVGSGADATYANVAFTGKVGGTGSDPDNPVGTTKFQIETATLIASGQEGSQNLVAKINFSQVA